MTVGDDGTHTARLGQRQCLAVVSLAGLGVEAVAMGRHVAAQVQSGGHHPLPTPIEFDRAVDQTSRIIEAAEH